MAKKDELLNEKNTETSEVFNDKSLELRDMEELQEDFSSMFDDDIEETDAEEIPESFPTRPLFGRYSKPYGMIDEKIPKKRRFPWTKKSEEDIVDEAEKEVIETPEEETEEQETVSEKQPKKSILSWKKKEKVVSEETAEEIPMTEETVEEVIEELPPFEEEPVEEVIEELPPFEEQPVEEVIEELPPFEEEPVEEVIEELPPFEEEPVEEVIEELPPFEEEPVEEVMEDLPPFEEEPVEEVIEELPPFEEKPVEEVIEELPTFEQKEREEAESMPLMNSSEDSEEKKPEALLTKKDHFTFVLVIVALILSIAFVCVKFLPTGDENNHSEINAETSEKLSAIQVMRQNTVHKYIQSDIEDVYYSVSSENQVEYFQCKNGVMSPLNVAGTVNAKVNMNNSNLNVNIEYVKTSDGVFGISIFRSEDNPGTTIHNVITFKLVNLPKKYNEEGKALLLAVANSESASRRYNLWTDSFIVNLETGATERFLTADKSGSASVAYSVLTNSACVTEGDMIPFFTTREYTDGSGKKDLFVKNGKDEALFATDVYSEFIYADKDVTAYLKVTQTGFNVVKKENSKEEKLAFALYGNFSQDYLYYQEYILNKTSGNLYNVKTGDEVALAGYGMSNVEMMSVSPDGKYLVVLGTVNNVIDYQVHIFDLKKNDYAKFEDVNFSQHNNLTFIDNTKAMYTVVNPSRGYEQVVFDVSKAF